ncbi:LCP family protein [Rhodococcus sp. (in: high G+C Gram-positive bacteria)]|uniref:LCP family protein n=1 Tax=Rhodococcus sp. TaxID=1831 RepID=UPI00388D98CB
MIAAVAAALALVVTGIAWQRIDSLRSSLASIGGLGLGGGEDGAVDILLVGTDSRTDAHGNPLSQRELDALRAGEEVANNTDTIIMIRVPNDGRSATALSIPRDTYVDVPGIGMSKINAAYGATKETTRLELVESGSDAAEAETESTKAGREALIESVGDLTGVTVDHYAEVGLLGFVLLTDAVGGVEVCLNAPVDEPLSGARFDAGQQTIEGPDALSFVRQRHGLPRGDLDRIVRQQVFMASLAQKVLSAKTLSNPSKVNQLTAAVQRSVVLDSDWDIMDLATQLQGLAGGDVTFSTIPVEDINAMTDYGESVVQVDPDEVRDFVAGLVGRTSDDRAPDDDRTTSATPAPDIDPSTVTVDVTNAGDVAGLASVVSAELSSEGYLEGEVGNYTGTAVSSSTVYGADEESDETRAVAAALGGLDTATDPTLPEGTVRVVLAGDYSGPGTSTFAGSESTTTSSSSSGLTPADGTATPAPAAPPIDAGSEGPRCVN